MQTFDTIVEILKRTRGNNLIRNWSKSPNNLETSYNMIWSEFYGNSIIYCDT